MRISRRPRQVLYPTLDNWLYAYQRIKDVAEALEEYGKAHFSKLELCIQTFLKRAKIYTKFQDYLSATKWYKMMVKFWWLQDNPKYEVIAYEGLSKWYYYLLDIPKSKFYHERFVTGEVEDRNSNVRLGVHKAYKNKHSIHYAIKPKFIFMNGEVYKNEDETTNYDFIYKYFDEADIKPNFHKSIVL